MESGVVETIESISALECSAAGALGPLLLLIRFVLDVPCPVVDRVRGLAQRSGLRLIESDPSALDHAVVPHGIDFVAASGAARRAAEMFAVRHDLVFVHPADNVWSPRTEIDPCSIQRRPVLEAETQDDRLIALERLTLTFPTGAAVDIAGSCWDLEPGAVLTVALDDADPFAIWVSCGPDLAMYDSSPGRGAAVDITTSLVSVVCDDGRPAITSGRLTVRSPLRRRVLHPS